MYRMKPAGADLDYPIAWELAEDDTITVSTWRVEPIGEPQAGDLQVVPGSETISGAVTACMLTGGVSGRRYRVINRVTTAQGRTDERSQLIRIGQVEVLT